MSEEDRLRTHPKDRLSAAVHQINLVEAAANLRVEPHGSVAGHRQVAVVKHGRLSVILFTFEKDGALKEHQAPGEVIIHVLQGRLSIHLASETVVLSAGMLLSLTPGERHSVHALEASDMLLSIVRPQ